MYRDGPPFLASTPKYFHLVMIEESRVFEREGECVHATRVNNNNYKNNHNDEDDKGHDDNYYYNYYYYNEDDDGNYDNDEYDNKTGLSPDLSFCFLCFYRIYIV